MAVLRKFGDLVFDENIKIDFINDIVSLTDHCERRAK